MSRPAAVAAFALGLILVAAPAYPLCVEVGKPIPEVSLPSLDGGTVALSSFKGKIVMLAFWASWCPRCEQELTFLEGVFKTSPDIVVVAINQESQNVSKTHIDHIRQTLNDWKIEFPVLIDRKLDAWNAFCMNALPTSIILDKQGIVRYAEANYYWASQDKVADVIQDIRLGR
ncbi:MAG: TlpA family protein disulfide reductase [Gemmatimonadota bacterium]